MSLATAVEITVIEMTMALNGQRVEIDVDKDPALAKIYGDKPDDNILDTLRGKGWDVEEVEVPS